MNVIKYYNSEVLMNWHCVVKYQQELKSDMQIYNFFVECVEFLQLFSSRMQPIYYPLDLGWSWLMERMWHD